MYSSHKGSDNADDKPPQLHFRERDFLHDTMYVGRDVGIERDENTYDKLNKYSRVFVTLSATTSMCSFLSDFYESLVFIRPPPLLYIHPCCAPGL